MYFSTLAIVCNIAPFPRAKEPDVAGEDPETQGCRPHARPASEDPMKSQPKRCLRKERLRGVLGGNLGGVALLVVGHGAEQLEQHTA